MTRTAHRIGLAAAIVVALAAALGAGTTAAYAESGTAVTSSISLSFSGGTRITVGDQASLFGFLSFSDGSPANGLTVHVTRTNPDHTQTVIGDVTTISDQGGFNFVDSPPARGELHLHRHLRRRRSAKRRVGDLGRPDCERRRDRARPQGVGGEERLSPSRHPDGAPGEARHECCRVDLPATRRRRADARSFRGCGCQRQRPGHRAAANDDDVRRGLRGRRRVQGGLQPAGRRGGARPDRGHLLAVLRSERRLPPLPLRPRAASPAAPAARGTRCRWRPATPATRSG